MEEDRRQLMSEVTEQNKLVDALSREKTCEFSISPYKQGLFWYPDHIDLINML